jgi:hypothetical protein
LRGGSKYLVGRYEEGLEKVYSQNISRLDNQTPSSPDDTSSSKSSILGQRELFRRTSKIRDTSYNKCPLSRKSVLSLLWNSKQNV